MNCQNSIYEITKPVKLSPKRDAALKKIRAEMMTENMESSGKNIKILCPACWTVRAAALNSILENYEALNKLWD